MKKELEEIGLLLDGEETLKVKNMTRTTLELQKSTRKRLKRFKIVKSESYEDELNRIMDKLEEIKFYNPKIFSGVAKENEC